MENNNWNPFSFEKTEAIKILWSPNKKFQSLEKERGSLTTSTEGNALTNSQVQTIQEFAAKVVEGLGRAEEDYEVKWEIIEALEVNATSQFEDLFHRRIL